MSKSIFQYSPLDSRENSPCFPNLCIVHVPIEFQVKVMIVLTGHYVVSYASLGQKLMLLVVAAFHPLILKPNPNLNHENQNDLHSLYFQK